ncbi:SemiSWEET transporter [Candidatus Roizmanbacteria bacterium]|nr:SemiSWEET transporter [Candidatus Roizmanbacteria bacterium]
MIDNTVIGMIAASLTTLAFLPQTIKTWKTRKTKDISLPMYVTFVVGMMIWLYYGFAIQSLPLIAGNIVSLIFAIPVLVLKLKHG